MSGISFNYPVRALCPSTAATARPRSTATLAAGGSPSSHAGQTGSCTTTGARCTGRTAGGGQISNHKNEIINYVGNLFSASMSMTSPFRSASTSFTGRTARWTAQRRGRTRLIIGNSNLKNVILFLCQLLRCFIGLWIRRQHLPKPLRAEEDDLRVNQIN